MSDYIIVNPIVRIVRISYGPGTYVIDKAKQLKHYQRLFDPGMTALSSLYILHILNSNYTLSTALTAVTNCQRL